MITFFSRGAAEEGISMMKAASAAQKENARQFQNSLPEMQNGIFQGAISDNYYESASQHVTNLLTESGNTNNLADSSNAAKNYLVAEAESMKSRHG